MVKQIKYIFVIMSAAYFLFAGTGYNISKNNCKCCRLNVNDINSSKLVRDKPLKCGRIFANGKKIDELSVIFNKNKTCIFIRVFVDTPIVNGINLLNLISTKYLVFKDIKLKLLVTLKDLISINIFKPPNNVFVISGRDLLSLKAVLRI